MFDCYDRHCCSVHCSVFDCYDRHCCSVHSSVFDCTVIVAKDYRYIAGHTSKAKLSQCTMAYNSVVGTHASYNET